MKSITTGLLVFSVLMVSIVYGHSGATGIVEERMDAMADMADKSKLVADMFKGKSEFDPGAIANAADAFARHGTRMTELFPDTIESRNGSKSEALPRIWEEWDNFTKQVAEFVESSESLKSTASKSANVGQLKKAFFRPPKTVRVVISGLESPRNSVVIW